ncbi:YagK/YfjJ domain-containing protein [Burkholderia ubonensis]|uniref:inovirus-type Gp2 protein n=1 Tax=Burkholderia ubonensis TaxID=101571 RepID=UPI0009B3DB8B|nr:inovirus-type Gp2 protein [Burkholderia ubonensis]
MNQNNEDRETLEVIAHLNERTCLEQTDIDGKRTTIIHKGYTSQHLFKIEKFVIEIEKRREGGFAEEATRDGKTMKARELYLCKRYYGLLNDWLVRYSELYRYSARVEVFYDVCKELGFIGEYPLRFEEPGEVVSADGMRFMDLFNMLIEHIRMRCQSREFTERERLRLLNAEKNKQKVLALEEAMFSDETGRSRWLVLSLTLRYKPEFRDEVMPETIQQHRDRFFAARRFNTLMSGIKNYVWAIEQGEGTGLHMHVILFYSTVHNHDEFIARQIGEYWVNMVTEGRGDYWNSNAAWRKPFYQKHGHGIGVGQIDRRDDEKRAALRKNLVYLAKSEQYLMLKSANRIRTFDMGQIPTKGKAGRPRAHAEANNATENSANADPFDQLDASVSLLDEATGDSIAS